MSLIWLLFLTDQLELGLRKAPMMMTAESSRDMYDSIKGAYSRAMSEKTSEPRHKVWKEVERLLRA
jgi:hypothetical protein